MNYYKYKVTDFTSKTFYYVDSSDLLTTILNISAKTEFDIAMANRIASFYIYGNYNVDSVALAAYEKALNIEVEELYD